MAAYEAGSVNAKITLDTKQFNEAIKNLKSDIKDLKTSFNGIKGSNKLGEEVEKLKKEISSLKQTNEDYRNSLNKLREENESLVKSSKKSADALKEETKEVNKYTESLVKANRERSKSSKSVDIPTVNIPLSERSARHQVDVGLPSREQLDLGKKAAAVLGEVTSQTNKLGDGTTKASVALDKEKNTLKQLADAVKRTNTEFNRFSSESNRIISALTKQATENEKNTNSFRKQQAFLKYITTGYNQLTGQIVRTTQVLRTFNFALLEGVEKETIFYQRTVQLASAMQRMNSQGTQNWAGRGQFGYSQYIQQITQMNAAMEKTKQIQAQIKQQQLDQYYSKVGAASTKYWNQIRQGTVNLNTYKSNMGQINKLLEQQTQKTQKLASAQYKLFQKYHTTNLNTYKANMNEINAALEKQTQHTKNADSATRQAGRGITSFNNGIVQTAHSGRILSNTLYQIRGALLSLKMIFTAMGGMALWGFATDIAEGVKDTLKAKNEMEAQLAQNKNVGTGGIKSFERELDNLTKTYKKVNKYAIGETVSSIGLEFDMTAKQMKKALPIVTMISSEYVRAGRKEEEAALAVKDILQGEFQRLSRETGVGKEELIAYGWDEDKTNIDGLLKALEKAALDRHWDLFAKKATSLNDVLTITKSRFSEVGADILNSATPMIVEGFNMLIGAIEGIQNAFNSLNPFFQNLTLYGGGMALFAGILTALPMITKGMGLAEIATLGWSKSILTAALNLNKYEVAQYGLRKAIAAVIAGTQASELANRRATSAILGRVLGVNQAVQAEQGLIGALVHSKMTLKGVTIDAEASSVIMGNLRQKIIYLAQGEIVADKASASWGKTIKSLITSTKLWGLALMSVASIGIISWFTSVAVQADLVKRRIEAFNDVVENGDDMVADAKKTVEDYTTALGKLTEGTDAYKRAAANLEIAKANEKDIEYANTIAKKYDENNKKREEALKLDNQRLRRQAYIAAGYDYTSATEKASGYTEQIKQAQYEITNSYNKQYEWQVASAKHMYERIGYMKQANVDQEKMNRYIAEYSMIADEAGEHLKQFYQGDLHALAYYAWDRLRLLWIDLWNDTHFLQFWDSVQKTWSDLKPTLDWIVRKLGDLGHILLDFFSTDSGQILGGIGALSLGLGILGIKLKGVFDKFKDVGGKLKDLGGKLKDVASRWKDVGDKAEEATEKMGGGKSEDTTSTGGINGDVSKKTGGVEKGKFWETVGQDARNTGRTMFKYMGYIAAGMAIAAEAIALLTLPMGAIALTGAVFERIEPQVRKGIEGLKLIAPTVLAVMIPLTALMVVMDKFKVTTSTMTEGFKTVAVGIALAITLTSEAILLMVAPLLSLGILGSVYGGIQDSVKQGVAAIKATNEALEALVPWIPVFIAGIALAAIAFSGVGTIAIGAVVAGIAIGIGIVTEAILLLSIPLESVKQLGEKYPDLSGVKQGAEALKATAEALGYVSDAMSSLVLVEFDVLAGYIGQLIGVHIGVDLTQLTGEGGLFDQLETFTKQFNEVNLTPIDMNKVKTISDSATGLSAVKSALNTVKDALKDLPNFNVDTRTTAEKYQDNVSGNASIEGITNYFEQLKEPINQLNEFIKHFNNDITVEPVDADKVATIQQSASFIGQIKTAIDNVKQAIGASVDAQWNANVQTSGILGAGINLLVGNAGQSSGVKAGLDELYNCVKDIMDFNTRIAGLTSTGSGNAEGTLQASNMVSALQTEINNLKTTLTTEVPNIKTAAEGIGKAVIEGFKSGMSGWSTTVSTTLTSANQSFIDGGRQYGTLLTDGYRYKLKIKDATSTEINGTLSYLDGKQQEFYNKGKALGEQLTKGYKDGQEMHSPGIMARSTFAEIGYIESAMDEAIRVLPQMTYELGQSMSSQYTPALTTDVSLPQISELSTFQTGLGQISTMANTTNQETSLAFTTMTGNVNQALTNVDTNATTSYTRIVNTTRTSLKNMQDQTTKNITAIKTSWKGMQTALIASAENIRKQTSAKIQNLQSNMASFWRKVQNPALLMSAGGHMTGTIQRRSTPPLNLPKTSKPTKTGTSSLLRGHYAGGTTSRNYRTGFNQTGISKKFKPSSMNKDELTFLGDYLNCLMSGKNCYAGGWHFNWNDDIRKALLTWHTHFGEVYDPYLTVGKFENDDFPVRGNAAIAKRYIYDAISRTNYAKYFDSNYGDDPVAAWNAGAFNCWDGANIIIALARAFGFGGGYKGHGSWNGIGHVWAVVPGLGIMDATAIQGGYGFTSPKVTGYGGGSRPSGTIRRSAHSGEFQIGGGETNNYGDVNVEIHIHGDDVEVDRRRIDEQTGKQLMDILGINPATGR